MTTRRQMEQEQHFKALENVYLTAPINELYCPKISISEGVAEIEIHVKAFYFHAMGAVHGSVYFKMLDDAAYFAVNSLETKQFVLTSSFTTYLTGPVSSGIIRSRGKVVSRGKSQFIAESVAYDDQENEIARGNGIFVRSKFPLERAPDYGKV